MNGENFFIVAVDGGAASGKSSTSKILSARFRLLYVNSGSHYRSLTWAILRQGISLHQVNEIQVYLNRIPVGVRIEGNEAFITLENRISGEEIRSQPVNDAVSHIAAIPEVRKFLLPYQRSYVDVARKNKFQGLIMEGRDVGSVIFPEADFRFFLLADTAERARRRQREGQVDSIQKRDRLDKQRKTAPLTCPEGAIQVDTTCLSLQEVVDKLAEIIQTRKNSHPNRQDI